MGPGPTDHSCHLGGSGHPDEFLWFPILHSALPITESHTRTFGNTSLKRRQSTFLFLSNAEFVHVTCFGHWNILEDMMQAEALHVLVDLAWHFVILPSVMSEA